jgi:HAD superfamily hydrolase (TIGR01484 family)
MQRLLSEKNSLMRYKAIMLDLDDTTVIHGKLNLPSKRVKDAIHLAKDRIAVCIATARTLVDTRAILKDLDLSGPCVLTNGTQIYDPVTKKIIFEVQLPVGLPEKLYALCKQYKLQAILYDGEKDINFTGVEKYKKALSIYVPEVATEKIDEMVHQFSIDPRIHVQKLTAWNKEYMSLDITSNEASKLHGIVEAAKILGISTDEIIGVGDGYNDFPLLMACGLKIAMGNAVPELKAIADFIAPTVYDDGVAVVIEKFVLVG